MIKIKTKFSNLKAWTYLTPWIVGFVVFTGGPIIAGFLLSLTRWNMLGNPTFVGLDNYRSLFSKNSDFGNTIKITLIYTILAVGLSVITALFLAILLNMDVKHKAVFQFMYFVPSVMPSVVMAGILLLMFNKDLGVVNWFLSLLGIKGPNWMGSSGYIWVVIALASVFSYSTGQMMITFNTALKDVPTDRYEASALDGASSWQQFIHVTLPGISSILLFNTVVATVNSFNSSFSMLFPLTNGGPGTSTQVLSLAIYQKAFKEFDMGLASAMAVILFVLVAIIGIIEFRLMSKD
ncbi:carbohydrate ABC transporter permease [Lapidilactobacillus bayanensis]|uniref:carbohydrate ABC transporter permease n=1 Tax=Lapidilactobacillus bayanensis TaxID=2485998 RepID=UPI000F77F40B|nr:sugar ABC transporter permease [Lapidilactobacillus bayanensis]